MEGIFTYAQNGDFDAASVFGTSINKIPLKKATKMPRAVFTKNEIEQRSKLQWKNYF